MPRKKKQDEPTSVLQPEEITITTEQGQSIEPDQEPVSCNRAYLLASLQSVQESISQLFEKQSELAGTQTADTIFDAFEAAFISRLEERLQPFVDLLVPEIRDGQAQLRDRNTKRKERRLSAFDRLKQIAVTVTDECKVLPPVVAVGEFVTWEPIENKENE